MKVLFRYTIALFFVSLGYQSSSQIVVGNENSTDEKVKKIKKSLDGGTSINFMTNWSSTNRFLEENEYPFGDSLGDYQNEQGLTTWSFGISISNKLNSYLNWEGGISFLRNGESYAFNENDSSYNYQTTYSYIGMPIKLIFNYGSTINFFGGFGIIPQMFLGYKKDVNWTTNEGSKENEISKVKDGYSPSSFVLSAVFNAGISLKLQERWSIFMSPEFRLQLNSTFDSKDAYIHRGRALGVSFGLIRYI